jgi:para-nitrobenzyl esterase
VIARLLLALTILLVFWPTAAAPAPPPLIVSIAGGKVRGARLSDGTMLFGSIPFASPPVGALRWKPPQPPLPWEGVRDARNPAPTCMQTNPRWRGPGRRNQSEDCLYLELRTPSLAPERPLPVMVWIHGGGNASGGSAGVSLSSIVTRGIVLVGLQYRLGPFGFLSHPALSAESEDRSSGNYGLLDQQAALRWVRENIGQFGGDAKNITIFGNSAGAQAIGLLIPTESGRGLFDKAIMQSGTAEFGGPPRLLGENEAVGEAIAARAGASNADAAALRALSADGLVTATIDHLGSRASQFWAQPVLDGRVITELPSTALRRNGLPPVPLIVGSNARELVIPSVAAKPAATIQAAFGSRAGQFMAHYGLAPGSPPSPDPRRGDVRMQLSSDLVFHCPAVAMARAHARAGNPVWQYYFDYSSSRTPPVQHFAELRYVLGVPGKPGLPAEAAPLQLYWANFAKTGGPNGAGLPPWPRFDPLGKRYLAFLPSGPTEQSDLRGEVCGSLAGGPRMGG